MGVWVIIAIAVTVIAKLSYNIYKNCDELDRLIVTSIRDIKKAELKGKSNRRLIKREKYKMRKPLDE